MELSIRKPSKFLYFTEAIRATFDFWKCMYFLAFYRHKKIDDSHPIMVVPGFLGSDLSTILLRWFIKKQGFTSVHGWELGRNLGHLEVIPLLSEKVESLYQKNQQKRSQKSH